MEKKDIIKLNKSSDNIWQLIRLAFKEKNWALLEQNLIRLNALQKYYCDLLNFQHYEIGVLRNEENYLNAKVNSFEKEELTQLMLKNGTYQTFKKELDELFKEN